MPVGVSSNVDDIWFLVSMALLDAILGHMCSSNLVYRFSDTGFQACFRLRRASFWRLVRICENKTGSGAGTSLLHTTPTASRWPRAALFQQEPYWTATRPGPCRIEERGGGCVVEGGPPPTALDRKEDRGYLPPHPQGSEQGETTVSPRPQAYDAELYALRRAQQIFDERGARPAIHHLRRLRFSHRPRYL